MLRPYSSLDYTWDEPSLPHRVLLALPGSRTLGVYALDEVRVLWWCCVGVTQQLCVCACVSYVCGW